MTSKQKLSTFLSAGLLIILTILINLNDNNSGTVSGISQKKDDLKVIVFDVGQGDAIFIETPDEFQILIDGGPDNMVLEKLENEMDFNDRYIDLIVLTHPHADHVTGLVEVLKRYEVGQVWIAGVVHTSSIYLEFLDLVKEKNIETKVAYADMDYKLDNIDLAVLYPLEDISGTSMKNLNNSSVVIKLTDDISSFLFMGDAEIEDETKMMKIFDEKELKSDILKIGHHGSSDSSSEDFLNIVKPEIAIISVGKDNSYDHPSLRIIRRLERLGSNIFRTDKNGDIEFRVNDNKLEY
jgi:competence protein ComEC